LKRKYLLIKNTFDQIIFLNEAIAEDIWQSFCMIIISTGLPENHSYCIQEFLVMEQIEMKQKKLLGYNFSKKHGIIFSIDIKLLPDLGSQDILQQAPKKIIQIPYCNFPKFCLMGTKGLSSTRFEQMISSIASKIVRRCKKLKQNCNKLTNINCNKFILPSEDDTKRSWGKIYNDIGFLQ